MNRTGLCLTLLLTLILAACGSRPGATEASAPRPVIPPGEHLRITVAPLPGTPEPHPLLILQVDLVDARSGRPLRGDVLLGDEECRGEVVHRDVSRFTLHLPGRVEAAPLYLCVLAEGYETWSQGYRYHLEHSRTVSFTVELKRGDVVYQSFCPANLWIDHLLPLGLGLLVALAHVQDGGGLASLLTGPLIGWLVWHLGRWGERWVESGEKEQQVKRHRTTVN